MNPVFATALLLPSEMSRADEMTIASGLPGFVLMSRAAQAVADAVAYLAHPDQPVAFLAGPGNNGGDAFLAARIWEDRGGKSIVFLAGNREQLKGDAKAAAAAFAGRVEPLANFSTAGFSAIVDGLFGAGLSRPLEGESAAAVVKLKDTTIPIVAIDLPSGVSGATGQVLGTAARATRTITFFRPKPGHLLEPGRSLCGELSVADIGIRSEVLVEIAPRCFENKPNLWLDQLYLPNDAGHKYDRGHAVVFSGPVSKTGAARLSAFAALKGGAGLVTVFSPSSALLINAMHLTAVMLSPCNDFGELQKLLNDERLNAFVLGPGFGVGDKARDYSREILRLRRRLVLDADGLTSFQSSPNDLFRAASEAADGCDSRLVLTPHMGEFKRLFPDLADAGISKVDKARRAADRSKSVVVLKGRDTVIAAPDGRAAINANGTSWLASAGTGDVLTGIIVAQLAQGSPTFEAACAGVWMHAHAAECFGPGLIAEDLAGQLPKVFATLVALRHERFS